MDVVSDSLEISDAEYPKHDKIPIRNIWFLFLYAVKLPQFRDQFRADIDKSPDFRCLISRLLCRSVERRLRQGLNVRHLEKTNVLRRVRGRIDILETFSRDLIQTGRVACRYDQLEIDTQKNRFVRSALVWLSINLRMVGSDYDRRFEIMNLSRQCRTRADAMEYAGVSSRPCTNAEFSVNQDTRYEANDRLMVSLSKAAFDLFLPTESKGLRASPHVSRSDINFYNLFEMAIGNFFFLELHRKNGWRVETGKKYSWKAEKRSSNIDRYMPKMKTDIILENKTEHRRIVIDTKFTKDRVRWYVDRFNSRHIYQIYSYLRSQEKEDDPLSYTSEGILLYPTSGEEVDETVLMQGHCIRFATVNLTRSSSEIVERLESIPFCCPWSPSRRHGTM